MTLAHGIFLLLTTRNMPASTVTNSFTSTKLLLDNVIVENHLSEGRLPEWTQRNTQFLNYLKEDT